MSGFRLAASAEMLFLDLPVEERVRRIARRGFEVEIWDWTAKDVDALAATGATFSSMTGYVTGSWPTTTVPASGCARPPGPWTSPNGWTARG
jgi:hydroxypyruvate isomerase